MIKAEEQTTVLLEVLDAVLRSWWTIVVGVCLGTAAAVAALHFLPKSYESSTSILVTPPKISADLVPTTVQDDMKLRMAALKEAVLSRPYLQRIIEVNYSPAPVGEELERKIIDLRWRVNVLVNRGLFTITFRDSDSERSANVANTLAQLYIDENAAFRTSRAEDATDTLEELAANSLRELNEREQAILDFKSKHPFESDTTLDANLRVRDQRQRDLEAAEQNRRYEEQQLEALRVQLVSVMSPEGAALLSDAPAASRLALLEAELHDLSTHYLEDHPKVRAKRREIEELRRDGELSATASGEPALVLSPTVTRMQDAVRSQERNVAQMRENEARIKKEIALYDSRIEATPIVQAQLAVLAKGYDALLERYRDYQRKVESAKGAEQMEVKRKGEQFEVIEAAIPSVLPVRPRPIVVFGANILGGLLLFVGPIVIRRVLHPLVWSEAGLRAMSSVPVLVTIPLFLTDEIVRRNRRRKLASFGLSALSLATLLAAIFITQVK